MKLTAEQLYNIFVHRKDVFSEQQESGAYFPNKRPITIDDIKEHLNGEKTIGLYCLDTDNTVKWACIDLDGADLHRLETEAYYIYSQFPEFSRILEESGKKGYHVWIFFNKRVPALYAQKLVTARLNSIYQLKHEVFPKQTSLNENRKYGNLVKLPLALHKVSGKRSKIIKMEGI